MEFSSLSKTPQKLIALCGPTATGKTRHSLELAKVLQTKGMNPAIINFDSLLFYKELNIGTAKPTPEEQEGIPHFLIGTQTISSPINAADFKVQAEEILKNQNYFPYILVGGSGFYLRALLFGMYESLTTTPEVGKKIESLVEKGGIDSLIQELKAVDPQSVERLHPNDHYRLKRAFEHYLMTGTPFSVHQKKLEEKKKSGEFYYKERGWDPFIAFVDIEKPKHREIIAERTKGMLAAGLLDEVQQLLQQEFTGKEKPMLSIGYKEAQAFLRGEISSEDELSELINIATHQLAKAQRTFFKKMPTEPYHSLNEQQKLFSDILAFLES